MKWFSDLDPMQKDFLVFAVGFAAIAFGVACVFASLSMAFGVFSAGVNP